MARHGRLTKMDEQLIQVARNTENKKDQIIMQALKHFKVDILESELLFRVKLKKQRDGSELLYIDSNLAITFKPLQMNYSCLDGKYEGRMTMEYITHYEK